MSKLVIVESPAKAKTIGKYLGSDYVVKASMGHLRDLPRKTMGVDLEHDFEPEYGPIEEKIKSSPNCARLPRKQTLFIWRPTPTVRVRQFPGILRAC